MQKVKRLIKEIIQGHGMFVNFLTERYGAHSRGQARRALRGAGSLLRHARRPAAVRLGGHITVDKTPRVSPMQITLSLSARQQFESWWSSRIGGTSPQI